MASAPSGQTHSFLAVLIAAVFLLPYWASGADSTNELVQLQRLCKELIVDKSKPIEARPVAERLLELTLRARGEVHQDTVVALHWVGFLARQAGHYEEAEKVWQRSLALQERLPVSDPVWFTRTLHMLAGVYQDQFDFGRAMEMLQRSLAAREEALGPDHPETAQIIRSLGHLSAKMGDHARAESYLLRALKAYEQSGPDAARPVAETLSNLGAFYMDFGDLDKAESFTTRALKMQEELLGMEHILTVNSLSALANLRRYRGDLAGAESMHLRSLHLREKSRGPDDLTLYWPLHQLAEIYMRQDRLPESEESLQRILKIVRRKLGPTHPQLAPALETLGQLHERRGDYSEARDCFKLALELSEKHLGPTHFSTTVYRAGLARIEFALGHPEVTLAAADQILNGEEHRRHHVLSFMSERQRLIYFSDRTPRRSYDLWATMGAALPVARAILRSKGLVLDSLLEDRVLMEASGDPEIRRQAGELAKLKLRLAQTRMNDFIPERPPSAEAAPTGREVERLMHQAETLETALARKVGGVGGRRRALSVQVEQVQKAIPPGAVLLEFLRYRHYQGKGQWQDSYGALALSGDREPRWVRLGPAEAIEKNIKLYQHLVRHQADSASLGPLLRELQQQVWAPVSGIFPDHARQIIICPDSHLNFLSFATLLSSSNHFLGEEYFISYVSSGRDLLVENKPVPASPRLFVWANPDFGAPLDQEPASLHTASNPRSSFRGLRNIDFRPLPGAEKEGLLLRDRSAEFGFERTVLHLGKEATEAELSRVKSPQVLHLATHGFVLPQGDGIDAPAGTVSGSEIDYPHTKKITNPMLRSGLALAGAKRTLDAWAKHESVPAPNDGIVTAEEIGCLDLRGTQLVVLSACDTGLGEVRAGEGVLGLRRGFIQAGAQALLMTLWPIDDDETAGFIPELYAALRRTGNSARALATVQRSWLKRLREEQGIGVACRLAGPFILSFQGPADAGPP